MLLAVTFGVLTAMRAPHPVAPLVAVLRGLVQLAALSFVLAGAITHLGWVALALAVMFTVAVVTSGRRIARTGREAAIVAGAMAAGIATALGTVFATGALAPTPQYLLAIGGIVVGNAMSIATLTGRRLAEGVRERWDEVEGWLALGATPRQATLDMVRHAVGFALVPTTDQTKTTGLVALPGAFVGAIFGGVSPLEAGRFQIVVLASIMAAGAITASVVALGLGPAPRKPPAPR